ncbi:MAG: ComF family protein [Lachnospiraceae bacterium]|nr:ComF family protein [Lachnospiraceae bacterium]
MLNKILDFVYPKRCAVCDGALDKNEFGICMECKKKIKYIEGKLCFKCGRPTEDSKDYCRECAGHTHVFDAGRSVFSYETIGESIYRFKYMNRPEYAGFYAEVIATELKYWIEALEADGIIPVPLHKNRLKSRGYNQAELISRELSKRINVPVYSDVILRKKDTIPQKKCDKNQRIINMKKAFIVNKNGVKLEKVIVVDDIFTTGSTIDSMASELRKSGVEKIYFITVSAAET